MVCGVNKVILVGSVDGDPGTCYMFNDNVMINITPATNESWGDK